MFDGAPASTLHPSTLKSRQKILGVTERVTYGGVVTDADLLVRERKEHLNEHGLLVRG